MTKIFKGNNRSIIFILIKNIAALFLCRKCETINIVKRIFVLYLYINITFFSAVVNNYNVN